MRYLVLILMMASSAQASTFFLQVDRTIRISKNEKMTFISDGVENKALSGLNEDRPYCAIENIRLSSLVLRRGQRIPITIEKLEFPNKKIRRYSPSNTKEASIFCDFTGDDSGFEEEMLLTKLRAQLEGVMSLREVKPN